MNRAHTPKALVLVLAVVVFSASPSQADPPWESVDDIMCRGASAVGFSYWWGGECWCRNGCSPDLSCGAGGCSGSCPNCTHWGSYGADCSGFVSRAWQVPYPIPVNACHTARYVAASFHSSGPYWYQVSRSNVVRGDALASTGHVVLFNNGDGWGWMNVYEAKGCSWGIVYNGRSCSNSYNAARRINISSCQCSPGQTQNLACGNCGTQTRVCGSNCQWGSWSSCQGQGPCVPGATENQNCCDCGTQSRSCQSNCQWGGWSPCAGPDPNGGNDVCDTALPGPCAEGRMRCVDGCLACVEVYERTDEVCDDVDNDCSGVVDDGDPEVMGATPPALAAMLVDHSHPLSLQPGEIGEVWVEFENVGTETWASRQIWLQSLTATGGRPSSLHHVEGWAAFDVPAVLEQDTEPGGMARFAFTIQAPENPGEEITESFRLYGPQAQPLKCPRPEMQIQLRVRGGDDPVPVSDDGGTAAGQPTMAGGCTCRAAHSRRPPIFILILLLFVAACLALIRARTK